MQICVYIHSSFAYILSIEVLKSPFPNVKGEQPSKLNPINWVIEFRTIQGEQPYNLFGTIHKMTHLTNTINIIIIALHT